MNTMPTVNSIIATAIAVANAAAYDAVAAAVCAVHCTKKAAQQVKKAVNISAVIPPHEYVELIERVMAMKPHKRKNFKACMTDFRGVRTKIIWEHGQLVNWDDVAQQFIPVKPYQCERFEGITRCGKAVNQILNRAAASNVSSEEFSQFLANGVQVVTRHFQTGKHYGRCNMNKGKSAVARTPGREVRFH